MGADVVLKMTESLQNSHCMFFFCSNSFKIPSFIMNLCGRGLYGIDTAQKDRKGTLDMPVDRKMKRGDF